MRKVVLNSRAACSGVSAVLSACVGVMSRSARGGFVKLSGCQVLFCWCSVEASL